MSPALSDPAALLNALDADAIRDRIQAIDRERNALMVLLRAALRAKRPLKIKATGGAAMANLLRQPEKLRILLTAREAAEALAISERLLWDFTSPRGPIPCLRLPGVGNRPRAIRYAIDDLRAWAERVKQEQAAK